MPAPRRGRGRSECGPDPQECKACPRAQVMDVRARVFCGGDTHAKPLCLLGLQSEV